MAAPVITSLSPASGLIAGGGTVTITGVGLTGATAVTFGAATAAFTVSSDTTMYAVAPAGSGTVNVTVTTPSDTSGTLAFTYTKYATVDSLKSWALIDAGVITDDSILTWSIERAECAIDDFCGTQFQAQALTLEWARTCWVDRQGWLNCHMNYPVSAVSAIQTMDTLAGEIDWQTTAIYQSLVWPLPDTPTMRNYRFRAYLSSPVLSPRATGDILAAVTYTAGYGNIPSALEAMTLRLAQFYYLQRQAPATKAVTAELGLMEVPLDIPPDIVRELAPWRNLSA